MQRTWWTHRESSFGRNKIQENPSFLEQRREAGPSGSIVGTRLSSSPRLRNNEIKGVRGQEREENVVRVGVCHCSEGYPTKSLLWGIWSE